MMNLKSRNKWRKGVEEEEDVWRGGREGDEDVDIELGVVMELWVMCGFWVCFIVVFVVDVWEKGWGGEGGECGEVGWDSFGG